VLKRRIKRRQEKEKRLTFIGQLSLTLVLNEKKLKSHSILMPYKKMKLTPLSFKMKYLIRILSQLKKMTYLRKINIFLNVHPTT
jgi:hypothetical protein